QLIVALFHCFYSVEDQKPPVLIPDNGSFPICPVVIPSNGLCGGKRRFLSSKIQLGYHRRVKLLAITRDSHTIVEFGSQFDIVQIKEPDTLFPSKAKNAIPVVMSMR